MGTDRSAPLPQLFVRASEIACCTGPPRAGDGGDPAGILTDSAVLTRDGRISAIGPEERLLSIAPDAEVVDCAGRLLTPGFVDSHTHALFGRWRADEYVLRTRGTPYMEIAKQGGGINASVKDLRARSEEELVDLAIPRLAQMLRSGTTTAEIKSGYGLSTRDEVKMLRAIRTLGRAQPVTVHATFLGAHEVPPEHRRDPERYVDLVAAEMIPRVAEDGLARFCDVFMEPGVFDGRQAERILRAGEEAGMVPKLHADELEWSGGAELAVALGAASADHLGAISEDGIRRIAASATVATLLPATLFFLGRRRYAPARALLDAGATVALASDFNPGSSPTANMQFVLTAACSQMGVEPSEALRAATAGGAAALRLADGTGSIRPGAPADLVRWDVASVAELPYRLATPLIQGVWKHGVRVA